MAAGQDKSNKSKLKLGGSSVGEGGGAHKQKTTPNPKSTKKIGDELITKKKKKIVPTVYLGGAIPG